MYTFLSLSLSLFFIGAKYINGELIRTFTLVSPQPKPANKKNISKTFPSLMTLTTPEFAYFWILFPDEWPGRVGTGEGGGGPSPGPWGVGGRGRSNTTSSGFRLYHRVHSLVVMVEVS